MPVTENSSLLFSSCHLELVISLGTNSSMFANCSVFDDVREVRSSVLGQNEMFESVRGSI